MNRNFFLIIFLIALSSCVARLEKHGYMFDLSDYDKLQEGVTGKERVLKIMGSPTLVSELSDEETWIYYSENVEHLLFFKPNIKERQVLVLKFNEGGVVKYLEKFNLDDENKNVTFVSSYTKIDDHEAHLFKSFIGNVGQVKAQ